MARTCQRDAKVRAVLHNTGLYANLCRIVEEGWGSALIMEDDMDWDVNIKHQLTQFAAGSNFLQGDKVGKSPYGNDWDLLWLGSCGSLFSERLPPHLQIPDPDPRKYLIKDDFTVPPSAHLKGNISFSWDEFPPQTRVVHVPGDNICSFAYALSAAGARKALFQMSFEGQWKPFDNHLSDLCRLKGSGVMMRCVGVVPSLFVHHRAKGKVSGDSDIGKSMKDDIREIGFTENILYGTRLNLARLMVGQEAVRQWNI